MNNIYEITKTYSSGKTTNDMWATTKIISEYVDKFMPEESKDKLYEEIYGYLSGGHYDECFAKEAVKKMYYTGEDGDKHYAPYFTDAVVNEIYNKYRGKITEYNMWDFFVTLHMIASDNHNLIMSWYPESTSDMRLVKYTDMAINWLNDEDWNGTNRIWEYLH